MVSLTQLQEIPTKSLVLLVGPPGSGKSTFSQETVLKSITMDLVIYVTTEPTPSEIVDHLSRERPASQETKCTGVGGPYCEWDFR